MKKVLFILLSVSFLNAPALANDLHDPSPQHRLLNLLPREQIDTTKLGVNAFVNDQRFGTISQQFLEVRDTLNLKHVRVLFDWNEQIQSSSNGALNYSFYDDIASSLPKRVKALVILTGLPNWMSNSSNWIKGNPRRTFFRKWIKPTVLRFRRKRKVKAFQIWNEPNMASNDENEILDFLDSPENYLWLLRRSYRLIKRRAPRKRVVSAAVTSIIQNYPETRDYMSDLRDLGAESYLDRWGLHVYGSSVERFFLPGGVGDFLDSLTKPIWVTETGIQGINNQLNYAERVWPFLLDNYNIERIYQYQFTEATDSGETFGLKNLTVGETVSDLYIHLRDGSN